MKRIVLSIIVCGAAVIARAETKVGIIGLDTSHAIAFTKIMNVTKDPAVAGFRVTHAYQWGSKDIASATNRYPKYIAQMKEMGVEIVPTIDALIASADCICLETNDGREHLWQGEKVFASGKPCFIDKPLAHNLRDAVRIYDLGRRLGAKNPVVVSDGYAGYEPLLREIVTFFRTGVAPFPPEETLEIFALMEAAEMSAKRGGAPVTLAEALAAARK